MANINQDTLLLGSVFQHEICDLQLRSCLLPPAGLLPLICVCLSDVYFKNERSFLMDTFFPGTKPFEKRCWLNCRWGIQSSCVEFKSYGPCCRSRQNVHDDRKLKVQVDFGGHDDCGVCLLRGNMEVDSASRWSWSLLSEPCALYIFFKTERRMRHVT